MLKKKEKKTVFKILLIAPRESFQNSDMFMGGDNFVCNFVSKYSIIYNMQKEIRNYGCKVL